VGIPGKSNAFAISEKLGLPGFLIDEAKSHLDSDQEAFEDVIKDLNDSRKAMEKEQMRINELKAEARRLRDDLSNQEKRLNDQKEKILSAAREEARKTLQEAKTRVDEQIRAMNKAGKGGDIRALEQERTKTRELLESQGGPVQKTHEKSKTKTADLHIGDGVQVLSMNLKGTVSSLPDAKGNLYVQMGILRSQVHISDVVVLKEDTVSVSGKTVKVSGGSSIGMSKAATISTEINLIGKTVDEAMPELEKYLDDAYLSHLEKVRIVHGRGTGALRNAVQQKLRKLKYIKEFHLGEYGEGDTGVTIAVFK